MPPRRDYARALALQDLAGDYDPRAVSIYVDDAFLPSDQFARPLADPAALERMRAAPAAELDESNTSMFPAEWRPAEEDVSIRDANANFREVSGGGGDQNFVGRSGSFQEVGAEDLQRAADLAGIKRAMLNAMTWGDYGPGAALVREVDPSKRFRAIAFMTSHPTYSQFYPRISGREPSSWEDLFATAATEVAPRASKVDILYDNEDEDIKALAHKVQPRLSAQNMFPYVALREILYSGDNGAPLDAATREQHARYLHDTKGEELAVAAPELFRNFKERGLEVGRDWRKYAAAQGWYPSMQEVPSADIVGRAIIDRLLKTYEGGRRNGRSDWLAFPYWFNEGVKYTDQPEKIRITESGAAEREPITWDDYGDALEWHQLPSTRITPTQYGIIRSINQVIPNAFEPWNRKTVREYGVGDLDKAFEQFGREMFEEREDPRRPHLVGLIAANPDAVGRLPDNEQAGVSTFLADAGERGRWTDGVQVLDAERDRFAEEEAIRRQRDLQENVSKYVASFLRSPDNSQDSKDLDEALGEDKDPIPLIAGPNRVGGRPGSLNAKLARSGNVAMTVPEVVESSRELLVAEQLNRAEKLVKELGQELGKPIQSQDQEVINAIQAKLDVLDPYWRRRWVHKDQDYKPLQGDESPWEVVNPTEAYFQLSSEDVPAPPLLAADELRKMGMSKSGAVSDAQSTKLSSTGSSSSYEDITEQVASTIRVPGTVPESSPEVPESSPEVPAQPATQVVPEPSPEVPIQSAAAEVPRQAASEGPPEPVVENRVQVATPKITEAQLLALSDLTSQVEDFIRNVDLTKLDTRQRKKLENIWLADAETTVNAIAEKLPQLGWGKRQARGMWVRHALKTLLPTAPQLLADYPSIEVARLARDNLKVLSPPEYIRAVEQIKEVFKTTEDAKYRQAVQNIIQAQANARQGLGPTWREKARSLLSSLGPNSVVVWAPNARRLRKSSTVDLVTSIGTVNPRSLALKDLTTGPTGVTISPLTRRIEQVARTARTIRDEDPNPPSAAPAAASEVPAAPSKTPKPQDIPNQPTQQTPRAEPTGLAGKDATGLSRARVRFNGPSILALSGPQNPEERDVYDKTVSALRTNRTPMYRSAYIGQRPTALSLQNAANSLPGPIARVLGVERDHPSKPPGAAASQWLEQEIQTDASTKDAGLGTTEPAPTRTARDMSITYITPGEILRARRDVDRVRARPIEENSSDNKMAGVPRPRYQMQQSTIDSIAGTRRAGKIEDEDRILQQRKTLKDEQHTFDMMYDLTQDALAKQQQKINRLDALLRATEDKAKALDLLRNSPGAEGPRAAQSARGELITFLAGQWKDFNIFPNTVQGQVESANDAKLPPDEDEEELDNVDSAVGEIADGAFGIGTQGNTQPISKYQTAEEKIDRRAQILDEENAGGGETFQMGPKLKTNWALTVNYLKNELRTARADFERLQNEYEENLRKAYIPIAGRQEMIRREMEEAGMTYSKASELNRSIDRGTIRRLFRDAEENPLPDPGKLQEEIKNSITTEALKQFQKELGETRQQLERQGRNMTEALRQNQEMIRKSSLQASAMPQFLPSGGGVVGGGGYGYRFGRFDSLGRFRPTSMADAASRIYGANQAAMASGYLQAVASQRQQARTLAQKAIKALPPRSVPRKKRGVSSSSVKSRRHRAGSIKRKQVK